jgi:hypothetical protein
MNARQLQDAIDKTRAFVSIPADGMESLLTAKKESVKHLAHLESIQLQRGAMTLTPRVTLQDIK